MSVMKDYRGVHASDRGTFAKTPGHMGWADIGGIC
jgi:hypothetical protein